MAPLPPLPTSPREQVRPVLLPWQQQMDQSCTKSELDMMPPPSSLVPILSRRLSTNLISDMKTEMMDDSSQSSEQYHNENSMDVHPSDSNMAASLSDNSMDSTCNSNSTNLIQNSLSILRHDNSMPLPSINNLITDNELKGIDLRMKGSAVDLINTQAPSLATLRHFGCSEANQPLPAQSAQSVENYLTCIENKLQLQQAGNLFVGVNPITTQVTQVPATPVPVVTPVETVSTVATAAAAANHILVSKTYN